MKTPPLARFPLEQLEVFFGRATPAEARIYARIPAAGLPAGTRLTGSVRGPNSVHSKTLPATFPLVDRGPGKDRVAEAVVPDPCFWMPDAPFLYEVRVSLEVGGQDWAQAEQLLGIRPFGSNHRRLILEGKPWVLRACEPSAFAPDDLPKWQQAKQSLFLTAPNDAVCRMASEKGAAILARVDGPDAHAELRRLARWPAVMLAVLPTDFEPGESPPSNLTLAVQLGMGKPPAWAKVVLVEPTGKSSEDWRASVAADVSLVAIRRVEGERTPEELTACLAEFEGSFPTGEWAGYVVVRK
jgi:hypothetical protein